MRPDEQRAAAADELRIVIRQLDSVSSDLDAAAHRLHDVTAASANPLVPQASAAIASARDALDQALAIAVDCLHGTN